MASTCAAHRHFSVAAASPHAEARCAMMQATDFTDSSHSNDRSLFECYCGIRSAMQEVHLAGEAEISPVGSCLKGHILQQMRAPCITALPTEYSSLYISLASVGLAALLTGNGLTAVLQVKGCMQGYFADMLGRACFIWLLIDTS